MDHTLAMGVATAFEVRGHEIEQAALGMPEGRVLSPRMAGALGELVACAVSLGFAIEIYLKILLSGFGEKVPPSHDLVRLFELLPDQARAWAQRLYDTESSSVFNSAITLAVGDPDTPSWGESLHPPQTVAAALQLSRDVFVTWRYPFEISIPDGSRYQFRYLHYGSLLACCRVFGTMCEQLVLVSPAGDVT